MIRISVAKLLLFGALLSRLIFGADETQFTLQESLNLLQYSVEETRYTRVHKLFLSANVRLREYLWKLIKDKDQKAKWDVAINCVGLIGPEQDVQELTKLIRDLIHTPDVNQNISPVGFAALAQMSKRGFVNARDELDKMCQPSYWEELRRANGVVDPQFESPFSIARTVLFERCRVQEPNFDQVADRFLSKMADQKSRKALEDTLKSLEVEALHRLYPEKYGINYTATHVDGDGGEQNVRTSLEIANALEKYSQCKRYIMNRDLASTAQMLSIAKFPELANTIQSEQRTLQIAELLRRRPYSDRIEQIRDILEAFSQNDQLCAGQTQILTTEKEQSRILSKYSATRKMYLTPIVGSEGLAKKFFPKMIGPTISPRGELVICIVNEGRAWYWVPFGWQLE